MARSLLTECVNTCSMQRMYIVYMFACTHARTGGLTARTTTSKMSLKSHPPPKDEKWARFKYDMKKKWEPVYEQRIGALKHAVFLKILVITQSRISLPRPLP